MIPAARVAAFAWNAVFRVLSCAASVAAVVCVPRSSVGPPLIEISMPSVVAGVKLENAAVAVMLL